MNIMDSLPVVALASAAIGGAIAGAAACYWPLSRAIRGLRDRLERSEQARNGAVERSAQAREQISQLNRAITELRRTHSVRSAPTAPPPSPQEQVEKALADGDDHSVSSGRREPIQAFADTQVMNSG